MHCTLFDVTPGFQTVRSDKPRAATEDEVKAYFLWLQERDNLPRQTNSFEIHWRAIGQGRNAHRYAIGATFGRETASQEREQGGWKPAQFESGAYSIVMPGCDFARQRVTMEILDEAGDVAHTSTMPIEPKKGGVIWDRTTVRKAAGSVAKAKPVEIPAPANAQEQIEVPEPYEVLEPVKALKPPSEAISQPVDNSAQISPAVAQPDGQPDIAALLARMDVLEARLAALPAQSDATPTSAIGRARRTPAHERAIRRAWSERHARRMEQYRHDGERDALAHKRRRTIQTARRALSRSRDTAAAERARADTLAAQLAKAGEDLARARLAPTYFDADTGAERLDITGRTAHHARTAIDRADGLQARLSETGAALARMQEAIAGLGDQVEAETLRRIKAEQALAAVAARKNGWPPAVQSVNVRFAS